MKMNITIRIEHELAPEAVDGLQEIGQEAMLATITAQEDRLRRSIAHGLDCKPEEIVELSVVFEDEREGVE